MNKAIIALLLGIFYTGNAYAAGVYIDQAGSSSTIDITQTGSSNEVTGDDDTTTKAQISGSSMDIDIDQIGNNNEAEVNLSTAGSTTLDADFNGDSNQFDIMVNGGTGGTHTVNVDGDGNDVTICGTNNGGTMSTSGSTATGTSCSTGISANDVTNTLNAFGDYNIVNIEQGAGTADSTNTITIGTSLADSNNNLVNIEQDNTEENTITMDIEGASNIVNIIQD